MFNSYLGFTTRYTKWIFYILVEFFGPPIGAISGIFAYGGLVSFLIWSFYLAMSPQPIPHGKLVLFSCFGAGLAGFALNEAYQHLSMNAYVHALYSGKGEEEEAEGWMLKISNRLGLVVIYAACSWAAYFLFQLKNLLEVLACGFFLFMVLGNALAVLRWFARLDLVGRIKSRIRDIRASIVSRDKPGAVVVPFRKRK